MRCLAILSLLLLLSVPVRAQEAPEATPAAPAAPDIHPPTLSIPSTDETPVDFSVGDIRYRVPRNYLIAMDDWHGGPQKQVSLSVNALDLKPYSDDTVACFTVKVELREEGCDPFNFDLTDRPAKDAAAIRHELKKLKPVKGPYGYDKFEMKADGYEYYKKAADGRTLLYACQIFETSGKRDGICESVGDKAHAGPTLHYAFPLAQLADIDAIDAGLHNLVGSFTIGTED